MRVSRGLVAETVPVVWAGKIGGRWKMGNSAGGIGFSVAVSVRVGLLVLAGWSGVLWASCTSGRDDSVGGGGVGAES